MDITFLGTGASEGWPAYFCECDTCKRAREAGGKNRRTRLSVLIDDEIKIDLPPDTFCHHMADDGALCRVNHILISHSHGDHFHPHTLEMRKEPFAFVPPGKRLAVYGNSRVMELCETALDDPENAGIDLVRLKPFQTVQAGDATVATLEADHMHEEDALNLIVSVDAKTFLYGHDTGWYPEETWEFLAGWQLDVVSLDCTNGPYDGRQYHMGIPANLDVKQRLIGQGSATGDTVFVANHFSHNCGLLHEEIERRLEGTGFVVAYDGLRISV